MVCTHCREVFSLSLSLALFFFFWNDDVMFWEWGCTPSTCVHNQDWYCDKMSLVQMHAPSFEAGSQITALTQAARSVLSIPPLLLNAFIGFFFFMERHTQRPSEAGWSRLWFLVRGMDTSPHKEAREHTEGMTRQVDIWESSSRGSIECWFLRCHSYLLSSPPALTMKRSPFVKRTLVRWAEWPRKRLCLAWNTSCVIQVTLFFHSQTTHVLIK